MKIHSISLKGIREKNEDVIVVKRSRKTGEILAGCFDGHGGSFVSEYLGDHLFKTVSGVYDDRRLGETIEKMHNSMAYAHPNETLECGSTLLLCRFHPSMRFIQTVNLGDSRAVFCDTKGRVRQLTHDHSPDTLDERFRITAEGQEVVWDEEDEVYRVNGYSLSRAFGDAGVPGISHTPVITTYRLTSGATKYVIMGCDGLWDVFSVEEACKFLDHVVTTRRNPLKDIDSGRASTNVAYCLAREALRRGSTDNVSVIVFIA